MRIESPNPEIDVDALMREIHAELAREPAAPAGPPPEAEGRGWSGVEEPLRRAHAQAGVGLEVPDFAHYRPPKRGLARAAARLVLAAGQLFTRPQRLYNDATLAALGALAERVRELEAEVERLRARAGAARSEASAAPGPEAGGERRGG